MECFEYFTSGALADCKFKKKKRCSWHFNFLLHKCTWYFLQISHYLIRSATSISKVTYGKHYCKSIRISKVSQIRKLPSLELTHSGRICVYAMPPLTSMLMVSKDQSFSGGWKKLIGVRERWRWWTLIGFGFRIC